MTTQKYGFTIVFLIALLLTCCHRPTHQEYAASYSYLQDIPETPFQEDPYYLVLLVNARSLDYSSASACLKTTAKHPSDGSKNGDVGHAWILLKGPEGEIEGGQSGETGQFQPKYMEGVIDNIALGSDNPSSYLFCSQCDGFFQQGNGGHKPTFAAKIAITPAEHQAILNLIKTYPYHEYSLTSHQCTTFVKQAAALAGLTLKDEVLIPLPQYLKLDGREHLFWTDPRYAVLPCGSPDLLEESLIEIVCKNHAQNATRWYLRTHPVHKKESNLETFKRFPERFLRYRSV